MIKKIINKFKNGFTLIELMVATGIFVIVVSVTISIFISTLKSQRYYFAMQDLQDNARFLMERMIKEIRMSKINDYDDINGKWVQVVTQDESTNQFCVKYTFESSGTIFRIKREESLTPSSDCSVLPSVGGYISGSQADIDGVFEIIDFPLSPLPPVTKNPRVRIFLKITPKDALLPTINIQNTVTTR